MLRILGDTSSSRLATAATSGEKVIQGGDLFDVLPTLEANSIDACVTDPPYGIGFMGKQWDSFTPGAAEKRNVPNRQIGSDNPNLKGRTRAPASSPSAVAYDFSASGLRGFQQWTERWSREVFRVLKPGAHLLVCGSPRSFHRMTCGVEDAGFTIRDCLSWNFGQGFPKSLNLGDGRGTALKPGWEPIIMARKPFTGSVTANVLTHGTGVLNIDACRIEGHGWKKQNGESGNGFRTGKFMGQIGVGEATQVNELRESHGAGRWPANVLLDEEAAALLDEQTGELVNGGQNGTSQEPNRGMFFDGRTPSWFTGDAGGASRFFYVAKPDREERDFGCQGLPVRTGGAATDRVDGSAGTQSPRAGAGRTGGARNVHPTVKPIALMRWLVRLVTPVNGTVLDPFLGSGTTGMACRYEHRGFIGIEREPEYVAIAERRIAAVAPLFADTQSADETAPILR